MFFLLSSFTSSIKTNKQDCYFLEKKKRLQIPFPKSKGSIMHSRVWKKIVIFLSSKKEGVICLNTDQIPAGYTALCFGKF